MQLELYKALKSINIKEELVDSVINAMEAHFVDRVSTATVPIVAEMRSMKTELSSKLDAFAQVKSEKEINRRWIIGTVLGGIALVFSSSGATVGILKAIGYL